MRLSDLSFLIMSRGKMIFILVSCIFILFITELSTNVLKLLPMLSTISILNCLYPHLIFNSISVLIPAKSTQQSSPT